MYTFLFYSFHLLIGWPQPSLLLCHNSATLAPSNFSLPCYIFHPWSSSSSFIIHLVFKIIFNKLSWLSIWPSILLMTFNFILYRIIGTQCVNYVKLQSESWINLNLNFFLFNIFFKVTTKDNLPCTMILKLKITNLNLFMEKVNYYS